MIDKANVTNAEQTGEDFHQLYYKHIEPLITPYENDRVKSLIKVCIELVLLTVFLPLTFYLIYNLLKTYLFMTDDINEYIILIGILIYAIWCSIIYYSASEKIREKAKIHILKPMTKLLGQIDWTDNTVVPMKEIQTFGFAMRATSDTTDDAFTGVLEDVPVNIQETELEHSEGSGKNRHSVTDFKGVAIILKMNKTFTGRTLVLRDKGQVLGLNINNKTYGGMEKVALESIEFEKEFEVYSTDQVEARYILTTSFMEKLENIKNFFNAKYVECGFFDGEILILLHTNKNLFEVGDLIHSFKNKRMYEDAYNEIKSITDMIKHLKLNIKTGL
ncbi:MAG: DUF3137 domain-containing protein [Clostridiaceae bacterium]|jgi:hypothetical protein|nr:DUF3137 domain-containing protein [Clostridiaceae bacterium]